MVKSKGKEAALSEREWLILEHLFLCATSTAEQLKRDVFGAKNDISFVYRKMRDLERLGLVERKYLKPKRNAKSAYVLSNKGLMLMGGGEGKNVIGGKIRPQSLLHDLELVDIRHTFRRFSTVTNYWTESSLQTGSNAKMERLERIIPLKPDAVVELARTESAIFLPSSTSPIANICRAEVTRSSGTMETMAWPGSFSFVGNSRRWSGLCPWRKG